MCKTKAKTRYCHEKAQQVKMCGSQFVTGIELEIQHHSPGGGVARGRVVWVSPMQESSVFFLACSHRSRQYGASSRCRLPLALPAIAPSENVMPGRPPAAQQKVIALARSPPKAVARQVRHMKEARRMSPGVWVLRREIIRDHLGNSDHSRQHQITQRDDAFLSCT